MIIMSPSKLFHSKRTWTFCNETPFRYTGAVKELWNEHQITGLKLENIKNTGPSEWATELSERLPIA